MAQRTRNKAPEHMLHAQRAVSFNARVIAYAHAVCASAAFAAALVVGCSLHYHKIVQNGYHGYPDEWFPSVSATIGDRYPERSIFQILIALTSGPRFLLLIMSFFRYSHVNSPAKSLYGLLVGVVRTVTCGGWVYITSTDDHDAHDVLMIAYIVLTIPWEHYVITSTPKGSSLRAKRLCTSITFFATLVPLVYWFIQHKLHRVAGAYSVYAYFEWLLIILDIGFDAWTIVDFSDLTLTLDGSSIDFTITPSKADENVKPKKDSICIVTLITQTINAFMFWSVITSLPLVVWYFPLWSMGISGFEVSILANIFPFLLLIPFVKCTVTRFPQLTRFIGVAAGVGAYKIEDPDYRLLSVGIGCVFMWISLANEVHTHGFSKSQKYFSTTFTLGLVASSIAKYWNYTNNPIWPIMNENNGGWNMTGLTVGLISALLTPRVKQNVVPKHEKTPSFFITALGLGSLLFSLHAMLTDSSTMLTWLWEGYPTEGGPLPVRHGVIVIIASLVGVYLGLQLDSIRPGFTLIGCASAALLFNQHNWYGFCGVIGYTIFLTASIPVYFHHAAKFHPGRLFTVIGFISVIGLLAHVWIVAYAFVPAGWILRERQDVILAVSTLLISLGLISFNDMEDVENLISSGVAKVKGILFTMACISMLIAYQRSPKQDPVPYHPNSKLFTAGIWTIHFGLDNDMWASERRMRDLIQELEVDVIGLLESDTQRMIMGNRDITQQLAEELNMYVDFGPGPNKHTWGAALLSKFPIVNSTHHLLPSPVGELAPAIHATLDMYGEMVDIVVFHSGQEEDVEDRLLQSLGVRDIMGSSERPMVLLSYLVTTPLEGNYNNYVSEASGMHDVDATDWDRWCEYILYKNLHRTGYARVSRGSITDTELQVAKFVVGSTDQATSYSQKRLEKEDVPEDMRFPEAFYGDGVREHRYHVFDEPRYFA